MKKILYFSIILFFMLQFIPLSKVSGNFKEMPSSLLDETEMLRVVVVLDISGSMDTYSFEGIDLPSELATLKVQIDSILNGQTHKDLLEKEKQLLNSEEMVNASRVYYETLDAVNAWYVANGFGTSMDVEESVQDLLNTNGCYSFYSSYLLSSADVPEFESRLEFACSKSVPAGLKDQLLALIPLTNSEYASLLTARNQAEDAYNDVRDAVGLSDVSDDIYDYLDESGYYDLRNEMNDLAPTYSIPKKMELAKQAGQILVELSRLDEISAGIPSEISLVTFSNYAKLDTGFTSDFDQVDTLIQNLETRNMTNIGDGLTLALDQLEPYADDGQPSIIILLSDGYSNMGMVAPDVLINIPERTKAINTSICALGIGQTEYDVDADLLQGLADKSEGSYLFAKSGDEIVNFFISCRQEAIGASVTSFTGSIQQGEKQEAGTVPVDRDLEELSLTLSHLEGDLNMQLVDPDGEVVTADYPGVSDQKEDNVQLIKIRNPKQGDWVIEVEALSIPSERKSVIYTVVASQSARKVTPTPEATPTPDSIFQQYKWYIIGGGTCLVGIVFLIIIVVVAVILIRKRM